ncbi:MAG: tRNA (guanosine(46)-N7)-methyltransferase TrmB [Candidatus Nomurabacteria bacterium]|nr:MAG: tRNA (guanosine(46)-N7)-methyltransferase TrmB [Candidatus Nomurabacteria bacterium]
MRIDPDTFVIKRRRKKYKFALFANSSLCYEFEDWKSQAVDAIELGAGTGLFSVEMATKHPEKQFVAVDVKADRLQKGAREAEARNLTNIRFIRARADQLGELAPKHSVGSLWLTFPDPFPKKRAAGRRMTHPRFLRIYAEVLRSDGAFFLKHDNPEFFRWSLEQIVAEKWRIEELSFDLHESNLSEDYKILTTYERRWLNEGLSTNFVHAKQPMLAQTDR